jgi:hypothetical protein
MMNIPNNMNENSYYKSGSLRRPEPARPSQRQDGLRPDAAASAMRRPAIQ